MPPYRETRIVSRAVQVEDAARHYALIPVISTFVYQKGLVEASYGYSTAVGLFNSVVNCILLVISNKLSKKYTESSLW